MHFPEPAETTLTGKRVAESHSASPCRARVELSSIFARIIQARRDSKAKEEDILQCFIDSRYEKVVHIGCMVIGIAASNLRRAANVSPRCDILYLTALLLDQSLGSN